LFLQEQIKDIIINNNTSEGVPGVGVAQTVDVSVKKNLVRARVFGLQDVEKVQRGLPALLDECYRGDDFGREKRGVSPRVLQ